MGRIYSHCTQRAWPSTSTVDARIPQSNRTRGIPRIILRAPHHADFHLCYPAYPKQLDHLHQARRIETGAAQYPRGRTVDRRRRNAPPSKKGVESRFCNGICPRRRPYICRQGKRACGSHTGGCATGRGCRGIPFPEPLHDGYHGRSRYFSCRPRLTQVSATNSNHFTIQMIPLRVLILHCSREPTGPECSNSQDDISPGCVTFPSQG